MSSINLDRTLYDELKPSKLAMQMPVVAPLNSAPSTPPASAQSSGSSISLLSNLLTQKPTISEVNLDGLHSSSPHTSMIPQQQAQILTNYNQYSSINSHGSLNNNNSSDLHDNIFNTTRNQRYFLFIFAQ